MHDAPDCRLYDVVRGVAAQLGGGVRTDNLFRFGEVGQRHRIIGRRRIDTRAVGLAAEHEDFFVDPYAVR